ncbi:MAG: YdcF family protein [Bradyrhizobium sp.]|nr:MAG: YdcF family protein [Bradyrhizobium sp.]
MFFLASKALWFFAAPSALLILGALCGLAFARGRGGRALAAICLALMLLIGLAPVGAALLIPLEDRFPPPPADMAAPYGIIVLGGTIDDELSRARGQATLDEGAGRLIEAAILARRFPAARIVYTGGSASLIGRESTEAEEGRKLLIALGVDEVRIALETRSRNTDENARFTAALAHPQPGQTWLIDTSAYHMPRAMGLFRKAGFKAVAYPVDYRTAGGAAEWRLNVNLPRGLRLFDLAVHEWIGLVAYRLSGRIDDWFPAP